MWRSTYQENIYMRRWLAVNKKSFPVVAEIMISLALVLLMVIATPKNLLAQTPALTTISDVGFTPVAGGGIEVRSSDVGWGVSNNRNLVGRFTNRSFALTRYARSQTYFLRSYDGSGPPRYSRYSAALHVDYPL
jgi:hypothetical protein